MSGDGDKETKSTQTRYPYTNDIAAVALVFGTIALLGMSAVGWADLSSVPQDVRVGLWMTSTLVAVGWLFGGGAVKAASNLMG